VNMREGRSSSGCRSDFLAHFLLLSTLLVAKA
jgi:hypothetical protein